MLASPLGSRAAMTGGLGMARGAAAGAPEASSLLTDLIGWWKLDEASGTRNDAHSTNHLTDNNTVTSAAGKQGNGGSFLRASSEYLSIADNAALSTGDIDFTAAGWFNLTTKPGYQCLVGKWAGAGTREWILEYDAGGVDRFAYYISADGTASAGVTATNLGSPALSTWYFIVCWHDAVGNTINVQVNNGTTNSAAHTTGTANRTAPFTIGASGDPSSHLNGLIDEVGFWKRVLTAGERTYLYNAGSGRTYSGGLIV